MNTFNAQSLASDKLIFGEEDNLFNPNYFEKDFGDILSSNLSNNDSLNFGVNFNDNSLEDLSTFKAPNTFNLNQKESNANNETFQAEKDFGLEADSFHFHFDNISQDIPSDQNIHPKIGRTENGILYMVDEQKGENKNEISAYESTMAMKTTNHSNILHIQDSGNFEIEESSNLVSNTQNATQESNVKFSDIPKDYISEFEPRKSDKSTTKSSVLGNEEVDLAVRRDVVNKTVLRIMRRFFMQKFKEAFPHKFKCKESKSKWYFEYVKKLVIELFGAEHPELRMLQIYMASIINPKHMTNVNMKETGFEKEDFLSFYNTIYKYSHTRLSNLFKVNAYKEIYAYFYNIGPMDQIIKSETSVSKNSTLYSKAFADFYNVFEGSADVLTLTTN